MDPVRTQRRTWPMSLLVLLFFLGVGATLPALPGGVAAAGGSPTELGVVVGVFPLAAIAGRLLAGRGSDRLGRVVVLRAGLAMTAVAGALLMLPLPVAGLVAARVLHGLADALVYTAAAVWVLDRAEESRRPVALARLGSAIWAGYALGPLVGTALDLRGVGLVVVVTAVVAGALTAGLPDVVHPGEPVPGLRGLLPRGVTRPGLALGLGNLGYAAVAGFLVLALDERGGSGAVALASFSVAVLLGRLLLVPLAVRVGLLRVTPYGMTAMAAGLVVLGLTGSTPIAAAAAAVVGLGYCLPFPALATLVAGRVPAAQRGAALGALTGFYDLFVGVGALVFGVVAELAGTGAVFGLAAVGVVGAAVMDALLARDEQRSAPAARRVRPRGGGSAR